MNLRGDPKITAILRGRERAVRIELVENDADVIGLALRSRDPWRRHLVPATPHQTVLLRIHLLTDDGGDEL